MYHLQKITSREHAQKDVKNKPAAKRKVVFPIKYTKVIKNKKIKRLFSNEIGSKKLITERNFFRTTNNDGKAKKMLSDFTITHIVTKVRYEKKKQNKEIERVISIL